jgi:hypothetical protein
MTNPRHTDITDHISIDRLEYLDRQEALFDAAKPQLLTTHPGEFVAFEDDIVLDHAPNERALAQRVFTQRPNQDILIRQVLEQEPIPKVRLNQPTFTEAPLREQDGLLVLDTAPLDPIDFNTLIDQNRDRSCEIIASALA